MRKRNNTKNTVQKVQNTPKHLHITIPIHTHNHMHTYTHPHIDLYIKIFNILGEHTHALKQDVFLCLV